MRKFEACCHCYFSNIKEVKTEYDYYSFLRMRTKRQQLTKRRYDKSNNNVRKLSTRTFPVPEACVERIIFCLCSGCCNRLNKLLEMLACLKLNLSLLKEMVFVY